MVRLRVKQGSIVVFNEYNFNSSVVRLREATAWATSPAILNFNSSVVRLRERVAVGLFFLYFHFNSSVVRLRAES